MKRNVYILPLILIILFIFSSNSHASPPSSEENLTRAQNVLAQFDQSLSLNDRALIKNTPKSNLSPHLQELREERLKLMAEKDKNLQIVSLKKSLLQLPSDHPLSSEEADRIAQTTIDTFEASKNDFEMIRPAALNNIFVNMKLKDSGLCWHWARNLLYSLDRITLKTFSFHWVTAYEGKLREHNAIAVYARGRDFEEGLVLDGWRHSGKPYWGPVKGDHYPWAWGEFYENNQNDTKEK